METTYTHSQTKLGKVKASYNLLARNWGNRSSSEGLSNLTTHVKTAPSTFWPNVNAFRYGPWFTNISVSILASEQASSAGGLTYRRKRTRLAKETTKTCMSLNSWFLVEKRKQNIILKEEHEDDIAALEISL